MRFDADSRPDRPPLLELVGVTKYYGKPEGRILVLDDISFTTEEAQFVALLGQSGSGKSTLLRIIMGLTPPSSGQVLYRGQPMQGVNPHAAIIFQTFALYPWLTALENVDLALRPKGLSAQERLARAEAALDKVGLDGFEDAYPRELSGGMRQRVGFARALAVQPELLLMDEPFSALDVLSAENLRGELLELWLSRRIPIQAILMVTHNIEEAVLMADRIVVMDKDPGRIIGELPVSLRQPRHRKAAAFQAMVDRIYAMITGETPAPATVLGTAPLHCPARLAAVELEGVPVSFGIQEHEGDRVGGLAGVSPAPPVLQSQRQLPGIADLVEGPGQRALGLVRPEPGNTARVVGGLPWVGEHVPGPVGLPTQRRKVSLREIGVHDRLRPASGLGEAQACQQCRRVRG